MRVSIVRALSPPSQSTGSGTDQITQLTSYSQSTSYNSLGAKEQHHHVPIHPNKPNDLAQPRIVYLRHRQKVAIILKKNSWINTRQIYKVPLSILRPYEAHQSWCRYRLTDGSIQALNSALKIDSLDPGLLRAPRLPFSLPVSQNLRGALDEQTAATSATDRLLSPFEYSSPQSYGLTASMNSPSAVQHLPFPDATFTGYQNQPTAGSEQDANDNSSEGQPANLETESDALPRFKQYPFHLIYPFDSGPLSGAAIEHNDPEISSPPATLDTARRKQRLGELRRKGLWSLGLFLGLSLLLTAVIALLRTRLASSHNHGLFQPRSM